MPLKAPLALGLLPTVSIGVPEPPSSIPVLTPPSFKALMLALWPFMFSVPLTTRLPALPP